MPASSDSLIEESRRIAAHIKRHGGRALAVGGFVRDQLLGRPSKDLDLEVFGLPQEQLPAILGAVGRELRTPAAAGLTEPLALRLGERQLAAKLYRQPEGHVLVDHPERLDPLDAARAEPVADAVDQLLRRRRA